MSISIRLPQREDNNYKLARANKIYVDTTYSQDGRSTESFWIDYDQDAKSMALFLLERSLNDSTGVRSYSVYDENGERVKNFQSTIFPKRV